MVVCFGSLIDEGSDVSKLNSFQVCYVQHQACIPGFVKFGSAHLILQPAI